MQGGITAQSMHATVRGLEQLGAVRRPLAGHGHPAKLEITTEGRQLLDPVRSLAQRLDAELLAGLDPDQLDTLRAALRAVAMPPGLR